MGHLISTDQVINVWGRPEDGCVDCPDEVHITPDWYQDNGTPQCGVCGEGLQYLYTEIETPGSPTTNDVTTIVDKLEKSTLYRLNNLIVVTDMSLEDRAKFESYLDRLPNLIKGV